MTVPIVPALFRLGQVVITANAKATLHSSDILPVLLRHAAGDWGELCPEDKAINQRALAMGHRLFSKYSDRNGVAMYVITEHDRAITTVLLPEDY